MSSTGFAQQRGLVFGENQSIAALIGAISPDRGPIYTCRDFIGLDHHTIVGGPLQAKTKRRRGDRSVLFPFPPRLTRSKSLV